MSNPDNRKLLGQTLDKKYLITGFLGEGGMGSVFKGSHVHLKRDCAIKIIRQQHISDPVALKRFKLEAEAASILKHPNIIDIYDFGITDDDLAYIVMEYLPGESLDDLLKRHRYLHYEQAIPIFLQVCDALAHAHSKKVLHRDLKPPNIMVFDSEVTGFKIKIVDFGIAKLLPGTGHDLEKLTQTGEVFGSPMYMSPEQCMGQSLDGRSDIYALGCIIYQTLTGKLPFVGDNFIQVVVQHINSQPPTFAEVAPDVAVPADLERITFQCLSKEKEIRFTDAKELKKCLQELYTSCQFKNAQSTGKMAVMAAEPRDGLTNSSGTFETNRVNPVSSPDSEAGEETEEQSLLAQIALLEERYGTKSELLIKPLTALHDLYFSNEQNAECVRTKRKLLSLIRTKFGKESREAAFCHEELGHLYYKQEDYGRAETCYLESLTLKSKCIGDDSPEACKARIHLANTFLKRDAKSAADELVQDALARTKSWTEVTEITAEVENMAANYYYDARELVEAYEHYEREYIIRKRVNGDKHIDIRGCLMDMARSKYFNGDYKSTIDLCIEAIEIAKANPQDYDIVVEHPWCMLGWSYRNLELLKEAEQAHLTSLKIIDELGNISPSYKADALDYLADVYDDMGESEKCSSCRKRAELLRNG